jgi:hypothetical protein
VLPCLPCLTVHGALDLWAWVVHTTRIRPGSAVQSPALATTDPGDFGGDNAVYLLTAQYFSPYAPRTALAAHIAQGSLFPPLFPLLLALTGSAESLGQPIGCAPGNLCVLQKGWQG